MDTRLKQEIENYKQKRNMYFLRESKWFAMFLTLLVFKEQYGHIDVPARNKGNTQLGNWVMKQRYRRAQGKLDPLREQLLKLAGI